MGLGLEIVFTVGSQGILKGIALPLKRQLIRLEKVQVSAPDAIKERTGQVNCRSKTNSLGTPIPMSKNGKKGQPRALKTQAYGAVSAPDTQIGYIPQRSASLSATLLEAPQETQD